MESKHRNEHQKLDIRKKSTFFWNISKKLFVLESNQCKNGSVHMYKKFQVNRTNIKGVCQSETEAANCYSCTDLTLVTPNVSAKNYLKIFMYNLYIKIDF